MSLLEKNIKSKAEAVVSYLNVQRQLKITKAHEAFEIEKLNDCKQKYQEMYEILRFERQEDERIHQR